MNDIIPSIMITTDQKQSTGVVLGTLEVPRLSLFN